MKTLVTLFVLFVCVTTYSAEKSNGSIYWESEDGSKQEKIKGPLLFQATRDNGLAMVVNSRSCAITAEKIADLGTTAEELKSLVQDYGVSVSCRFIKMDEGIFLLNFYFDKRIDTGISLEFLKAAEPTVRKQIVDVGLYIPIATREELSNRAFTESLYNRIIRKIFNDDIYAFLGLQTEFMSEGLNTCWGSDLAKPEGTSAFQFQIFKELVTQKTIKRIRCTDGKVSKTDQIAKKIEILR